MNYGELDYVGAHDGFFQNVQTVAGQSYTLSFDARSRPGLTAATCTIEVLWNNTVVATVPPGSAWATHTFSVTGTGGQDRLTFREVQSQSADGLGALYDNIRLVARQSGQPAAAGGGRRQRGNQRGRGGHRCSARERHRSEPGHDARHRRDCRSGGRGERFGRCRPGDGHAERQRDTDGRPRPERQWPAQLRVYRVQWDADRRGPRDAQRCSGRRRAGRRRGDIRSDGDREPGLRLHRAGEQLHRRGRRCAGLFGAPRRWRRAAILARLQFRDPHLLRHAGRRECRPAVGSGDRERRRAVRRRHFHADSWDGAAERRRTCL